MKKTLALTLVPLLLCGCYTDIDTLDLSMMYYHRFEMPITNKNDGEYHSAENLLSKINKAMKGEIRKEEVPYDYGSKFFIAFVREDCSMCRDSVNPMSVFEAYLNQLTNDDVSTFSLYSIFFDDGDKVAPFLNRNKDFFNRSAEQIAESPYYLGGNISENDYVAIKEADADNLVAPTFFLVDYTTSSPRFGVSEIFVGLKGETIEEKTEFIKNAWNHTGIFGA